jgi:N-acetylmuramic acid 6-phosphate etherase
VLLTFNPHASFQLKGKNFLKIAVETGPEVVTGSTRLKAGTATKLILNLISTITMVRLGKVKSNLMVDLEPTCEKLHDRAARIYSALRGGSHEEAWETLKKHDWQLRKLLNTRGSRR